MTTEHRWIEKDRFGNDIYLTDERWEHITDAANHCEMADYEIELRETIKNGKRKQEMLNPQKYRYSKKFNDLTANNTHLVAIVKIGLFEDEAGKIDQNNFVLTAYQKKVW